MSRLTILQSIMEYNGGSVIAMVGKDCVAIASDLRLGNQALGISSNFQKVLSYMFSSSFKALNSGFKIFPVTDRIYVGLPGLATDVTTLCVQGNLLRRNIELILLIHIVENVFDTE